MMPTDAAARQVEREVVDQQAVAKTFRQTLAFHDQIAEPFARRDVDLVGLVALLEFLRGQFLEALHARLALGLPRFRVLANPLEFLLEHLLQAFLLALFLLEARVLLLQP